MERRDFELYLLILEQKGVDYVTLVRKFTPEQRVRYDQLFEQMLDEEATFYGDRLPRKDELVFKDQIWPGLKGGKYMIIAALGGDEALIKLVESYYNLKDGKYKKLEFYHNLKKDGEHKK